MSQATTERVSSSRDLDSVLFSSLLHLPRIRRYRCLRSTHPQRIRSLHLPDDPIQHDPRWDRDRLKHHHRLPHPNHQSQVTDPLYRLPLPTRRSDRIIHDQTHRDGAEQPVLTRGLLHPPGFPVHHAHHLHLEFCEYCWAHQEGEGLATFLY